MSNALTGSAMNVRNVRTVSAMTISAIAVEPVVPVRRYATVGKAVPTVQLSVRAVEKPVPIVKLQHFAPPVAFCAKTVQLKMKYGVITVVPAELVLSSVNAAAAVTAVPMFVQDVESNVKTVQGKSVRTAATASAV